MAYLVSGGTAARWLGAAALLLSWPLACSQAPSSDDDSGGDSGNAGAPSGANGGKSSGGIGGTNAAAGRASGSGGTETGGTGGSGGAGGSSATSAGGSGGVGGAGGSVGGTGGSVGGASGSAGRVSGVGGASSAGGGNTSTGGRSGSAGSGTGGSSGGSAGSPTTYPPLCQTGCQIASDCGSKYYACTDGMCVFTGCQNDSECDLDNPGYVCRVVPSVQTKGCSSPCTTAEDCSLGLPAWDGDNFVCDNGGCVFHGCNDDAECDATYAGYVCRPDGAGAKACTPTCTTPDDCALINGNPAYTADHYTCDSGLCTYHGCRNDAECNIEGSTVSYVCRPWSPPK